MQYIKFTLLILILHTLFSCTEKKENSSTANSKSEAQVDKQNKQPDIDSVKFLYGIDISQAQGNEITRLNNKKDSLTFIICKATEGITFTDSKFAENWLDIKANGFVRGAYHFYRSDDAPQPQAANYLKAIAKLEKTDLPPIIDFEEYGIDKKTPKKTIQKTLLQFLKIIADGTGRTPMIYADVNVCNSYLDHPEFSKYPLWLADYVNNTSPEIPSTWKSKGWTFWQKTDNYTIGDTKNDFDLFNGNLSDLKKFIEDN